MASFSAREYGEMIMCYGEAQGNAREALRIYVERYPDRRHPSDSHIITRKGFRLSPSKSAHRHTHRKSIVTAESWNPGLTLVRAQNIAKGSAMSVRATFPITPLQIPITSKPHYPAIVVIE
ncbi:hypothetical protein EVAR_31003_1 [Eumeta japonica]|uniref:DUF4817 domain-containing protein n=1 Tax=Eumeta variegata TaxID=151549 RepID=A0A4C1VH00_EUMVA|nr:hypothetical protein EVAR_31003_1 [Eumeta japonica]